MSSTRTTQVVPYFSLDFYSPTPFVVSTTSSESQVVKNFHLGQEKLFTVHYVMNATCKK